MPNKKHTQSNSRNITIVYISQLVEDKNINWYFEFSRKLSQHYRVIYTSSYYFNIGWDDKGVVFFSFFYNFIKMIVLPNYFNLTQIFFYNLYPSTSISVRLRVLFEKLNHGIKILELRLLRTILRVQRRSIIVVSNSLNDQAKKC